MDENVLLFAFLLTSIIIGLLPAFIAEGKGHDFVIWWIYGAAFFLVAIIHAILLQPTDEKRLEDGMKKCPHCAELVKPEARICPHCRGKLVKFADRREYEQWKANQERHGGVV